jgi:ABC-2 type transport system permease protein
LVAQPAQPHGVAPAEAEFLLGLAIISLARLVLGLSFVALAAWGLYAFNVTSAGWGLVPVVGVLMATGWAMSLVVIALVLRFGNGAEILCWGILFVVVALSGAFYPLSALPGVLQPVVGILPSTHAFEAARRLLDGASMPWGEIGAAIAGLALLGPLAMAFLARMLHVFRQRGYVTRVI